MHIVIINEESYTTQPQPTAAVPPFNLFLDFHRRPTTFFRHGYYSLNDKTESNKKERSSRTIVHGVYRRYLSDDTIITSSSDKKEMVCIKRRSTNCSTRKAFLEKQC